MEKNPQENSLFRLQSEIKDLEDQKEGDLSRQKENQHSLADQIRTLRAEVRVLEIKLKEKE